MVLCGVTLLSSFRHGVAHVNEKSFLLKCEGYSNFFS
jgi:hypothetical protein